MQSFVDQKLPRLKFRLHKTGEVEYLEYGVAVCEYGVAVCIMCGNGVAVCSVYCVLYYNESS